MSLTSYQPHFVTKETTEHGVTVAFLSKHHGLTQESASHEVEGFKVFVNDLHHKGYKAQAHLKGKADKSGYYRYTQEFAKKS